MLQLVQAAHPPAAASSAFKCLADSVTGEDTESCNWHALHRAALCRSAATPVPTWGALVSQEAVLLQRATSSISHAMLHHLPPKVAQCMMQHENMQVRSYCHLLSINNSRHRLREVSAARAWCLGAEHAQFNQRLKLTSSDTARAIQNASPRNRHTAVAKYSQQSETADFIVCECAFADLSAACTTKADCASYCAACSRPSYTLDLQLFEQYGAIGVTEGQQALP